MQPIFDMAMVTNEMHQTLRRAFLGHETGDAKGDFIGQLARFLMLDEAL